LIFGVTELIPKRKAIFTLVRILRRTYESII